MLPEVGSELLAFRLIMELGRKHSAGSNLARQGDQASPTFGKSRINGRLRRWSPALAPAVRIASDLRTSTTSSKAEETARTGRT